MDDVVNEPAADWDDANAPAPIPAPVATTEKAPLQALALHDEGDGMVQVRYLSVSGKVRHATLPASTPMLIAFQHQLATYFTDIEGAASHFASTKS
jgi:hypothetical protein